MRRRHALIAWLAAAMPGAAVTQSAPPPAAETAAPVLDVNMAERADLESLAGLGPALAGRILAARQAGPFVSWADLMRRVSGLGPKLARQLSEQGLRVQNEAYRPAA